MTSHTKVGGTYYKVKTGQRLPPDYMLTITGALGRPSKYGSNKTEYNGITYASKREADYAAELDIRVRVGELQSWESQIIFPLVVNGIKIGKYTIDFKEVSKDGGVIYTETKGYADKTFKLRWKIFRALYPDINAQIVS